MIRRFIAVGIAAFLAPSLPAGAQGFRTSLGLGAYVPTTELGVHGASVGRHTMAPVVTLGIEYGTIGRHLRLEMVQALMHGTSYRTLDRCKYWCGEGHTSSGRFVAVTLNKAHQFDIGGRSLTLELGGGVRDYRRADLLTILDAPPPDIPGEAIGGSGRLGGGDQVALTIRLGASHQLDVGPYRVVASAADHVSRSRWQRTQHDLVFALLFFGQQGRSR